MKVTGRLWRTVGWQFLVAIAMTMLNYLLSWPIPAPHTFIAALLWWSGIVGMLVTMMAAAEFGFSREAAVVAGLAANVAVWTTLLLGVSRMIAFVRRRGVSGKSSAA